MGRMFAEALGAHDPEHWYMFDLTEPYQAARRVVFDTCERMALPSQPGEAVLVHRHLVHGVAPWSELATASPEGRMIAYFRPEFATPGDWLDQP
jgi:hypothetical protein